MNNGISKIMQIQEFDHLFDVGVLFFFRNMKWLAQVGRKAHGLAHCRGSFVDIHLLSVCGRSREVRLGRTSRDEDVSRDYASVFSFSQYVEACCLSSARGPHECSQRSRPNVAIYVVKKLARAV